MVAFHGFQLVPSVITHFPVWFSFMFLRFQATPNHLGVSGNKPGRSPIKKAVFDTVVNFPLSKLIEPSWIWKGGRDIPTLAMRYSILVIVFKTGRGSSFYSLSLR